MRIFQHIVIFIIILAFCSCTNNLFTPLLVTDCSFSSDKVEVSFSETVNQYQTREAFSLKSESSELEGTFNFDGCKMFFYPYEGITDGNRYILTISTGAEDIFGNSLIDKYVYIYETKTDFTAPEIISITPDSEATLQNQVSEIEIVFSEEINPVSFRNALSISPSIDYTLLFAADGKSVRIVPTSPLTRNKRYTVTVSKDLTDLNNNHLLNEYSSIFTNYADSEAPVYSVFWNNNGTQIELAEQISNHDILKDAVLTIVFDEKIDVTTVTSHISIFPSVGNTITPDKQNQNKVSIEFTNDIEWEKVITLEITEGIKDLADNETSERKQYELVFDNIANRPVQFLSCYLDLLENAGSSYYAELTPFCTQTFNVEKFPIGSNNSKSSHLFMLFEMSSQATTLNPFSAMKALSVSSTNSCIDIEIKTMKVLSDSDIAADTNLQAIVNTYSQSIEKICVLDAGLEISNSVSTGVITLTISDDLQDNLENSLSTDKLIIINKQ